MIRFGFGTYTERWGNANWSAARKRRPLTGREIRSIVTNLSKGVAYEILDKKILATVPDSITADDRKWIMNQIAVVAEANDIAY